MKRLNDYSIEEYIKDLPSLDRENTGEVAVTIDRLLGRYNAAIPSVLIYPAIDSLPGELVDALAAQLHCDFYDKTLPLNRRREIVKESIAWHRIKGTPAAVEMVAGAVFPGIEVQEWFDYGGNPYFFRLVLNLGNETVSVSRDQLQRLYKAVNAAKNVRSWLERIIFKLALEENIYHSEEIAEIRSRLVFRDDVPYGNRIWVPEHDGFFRRDGEIFRFGRDDVSMDELFLGSLFRFFDDVSLDELCRNGMIRRNGEFFRDVSGILPTDLGFLDFAMRNRFSETVKPPEADYSVLPFLQFADTISYGRKNVPCRDGGGYHDGAWERVAAAELSPDEIFMAARLLLQDDVSTGFINRHGTPERNGLFLHGLSVLPADLGLFDIATSYRFRELVPTIADEIAQGMALSLSDYIPYGRKDAPFRDGEGYHDGAWERIAAAELSPDELLVAASLSLYDDASVGKIDRNGNPERTGNFLRGANVLPVDCGLHDVYSSHGIKDTVPATQSDIKPSAAISISDVIPYGSNPVPDGDGAFIRDGPDVHLQTERGGRRDLEHDFLVAEINTAIGDEVTVEAVTRNTLVFGRAFDDTAEPIDAGGGISVNYQIGRVCYYRRDGTVERGGYRYGDDLNGSLSLQSFKRDESYCRDGATARADDGRLIAI